MSSRTETQNAFETTLAGPLNSGVLFVAFTSVTGLGFPMYVTLEPEDPTKLEYLKIIDIVGTTVEFEARDLEGSVGDVDHVANAVVRLTWTKQLQDDIFNDIEALEDVDAAHVLVEAAHHSRYQDSEVDAIVATHAAVDDAHHAEYLDADAVTAMGVKGDSNALHHDRYTDGEAAAKIASDDLYVPRAEGIDATWSDYSPAWGGGLPDIGNGVLAGRFIQIGDMVTVIGFLRVGSTTDLGSGGAYNLSLPVARADDTNARQGFNFSQGARVWEASFGKAHPMVSQYITGTNIALIRHNNDGIASSWSRVDPLAMVENDEVHWMLTYEAL
jgi:hypothetical protein